MKRSNLTSICSVLIITLFIFTGPAFGDDALYIDENGNVGIGTTSPGAKLDLELGNPTSSTANGFEVNGYSSSSFNVYNSLNNGILTDWYDSSGSVVNRIRSYGNSYFNSGSVGIGTSSPSYPLSVIGNSGSSRLALFANNDFVSESVGSGIYFATGATSGDTYSIIQAFDAGSSSGANLILNKYSGSVGIGTSSLSAPLHVYHATTNSVALFESGDTIVNVNMKDDTTTGSGYAISRTGDTLKFFTSDSSRMMIDSSGNVGIGTTSPSYKLQVIGDGDFDGDLTADSYSDHTPYYEGDALSEIVKITGKDGEIDHSTLPDFAHKTAEVPTFEQVELSEIRPEDAFETVEVEREKVQIGTQKESKGFKVIDGEIVEVVEEIPIYETETIQVTQLKKDVYLDEQTGKVYQMQGDGEVFEKDGRIYQQNQTGITIEDQRDLGAMISMLTVAIQQQQKEIEELKSMLQERN